MLTKVVKLTFKYARLEFESVVTFYSVAASFSCSAAHNVEFASNLPILVHHHPQLLSNSIDL